MSQSRPEPLAPELSLPVVRWEKDPLVVVSRRKRNIAFPLAVLLRQPTEADVHAWEQPPGKDFHEQSTAISARNDRQLTLEAGVTFLGCYTTAWTLRGIQEQRQYPKAAPEPDTLILVSPASSARDHVLGARSPSWDREAQRIDAFKVSAGWERVLKYLHAAEDRTHARDPSTQRLFTADDGFETPEVAVLRLSELLNMSTDAARAVHPYVMTAIPWAKNPEHLGALHDYAVRSASGWLVAGECRKRAHTAPTLATTVG